MGVGGVHSFFDPFLSFLCSQTKADKLFSSRSNCLAAEQMGAPAENAFRLPPAPAFEKASKTRRPDTTVPRSVA